MTGKPWWASKTLWTNLVALLASVGVGFGLDLSGQDQAAIVGGVMAVVNIALRFATNEPVTTGTGGG